MQRTLTTALRYDVYVLRTTVALAAMCALSVFLYCSFLLLAVVHTAQRTDAGRQITAVTSRLSDLEAQYLADTKELTPDRATALGFVAPTAMATVFTAPSGVQLGYNQPAGALSITANE